MIQSPLWKLADAFQVVPQPPNKTVSRLLAGWWEFPREFGCPKAKSSLWFVVIPDPQIWCGACAMRSLRDGNRCLYCDEQTDPVLDQKYVFEMSGITIFSEAHVKCEQKAEEK